MMGGIRAGLVHIYTSPITINTWSIIVKGRVEDLLIPTSTSWTITPTISSFKFRYDQQYTMVPCVMGESVAGLGPISNSTITTNSFYRISRGKAAGIFRPTFTSTIINSYIPPQFTIFTTYISDTIIIIIRTDITLLFFMNILISTRRRYWKS